MLLWFSSQASVWRSGPQTMALLPSNMEPLGKSSSQSGSLGWASGFHSVAPFSLCSLQSHYGHNVTSCLMPLWICFPCFDGLSPFFNCKLNSPNPKLLLSGILATIRKETNAVVRDRLEEDKLSNKWHQESWIPTRTRKEIPESHPVQTSIQNESQTLA